MNQNTKYKKRITLANKDDEASYRVESDISTKCKTGSPKPYNQTTEGRYTGSGHVRGYCGLVNTAKPISEYIPECEYFIEPFAGLGRISKQVNAKVKVLNDLGDYACNYNRLHFPDAIITQEDFVTCVKRWDKQGRILFFDPPWSKSEYANGCHGRAVCTMSPKQYYEKIFELLPSLESDWFVAGNKKNTMLLKSKYYQKMFESEKAKIMGGKIKTLVISNKPFIKQQNTPTLESWQTQ